MNERFDLADADFWSRPFLTADLVDRTLSARDFSGMRIAAPERVSLDRDPGAPVLVYERAAYGELWGGDFGARGIVVALEQGSGALYAGSSRLVDNPVSVPSPPSLMRRPDGEPDVPPQGSRSRLYRVDLVQRVEVPWRPGRYSIWAVRAGARSDPATTTFELSEGHFRDPEVMRFIESRRVVEGPGAPWPTPSRTGAIPASAPPVPETIGIALRVDPRASITSRARWALAGSLRLPVRPQEVVGDEYPTPRDFPRPTAIVRAHLVVTGDVASYPIVIPLRVACFEPISRKHDGTPIVTGAFVVDLFDVARLPIRAGRYWFHAFSGSCSAEPAESVLA